MSDQHFDLDEGRYGHEAIDHWTFLDCEKPALVSASRPPVFNADNTSCDEAASYCRGRESLSLPGSPNLEPGAFSFGSGRPTNQQYPQSNASSSPESISCPEGPEGPNPNITITNNYLPLAPEAGLNENAHRSSFRSEMSYQMRRFLIEQEDVCSQEESGASEPTDTQYLKNDMHMQSSMQVHRGSKGSKPSYMSMQSSSGGSGEASFVSWGADPTTGTGTQFEDGDGVNGYPLAMSGLTEQMAECALED